MRLAGWLTRVGAGAVAVVLCSAAAFADPQVRTLAGSGVQAAADGSAGTAAFVLPEAVTVGPVGSVYVADAGANRICVITRGTVRTLAGGNRTPGFADGTGAAAKFDFPEGIAVAPDGTVYVADANNRV